MSAQQIEELWQYRAACRGPQSSIFFPPTRLERRPDKRMREQRAKEICADCPVQTDCLQYAVAIREQHGIWGGLTEKERRRMLTEGLSQDN